MTMSSFVRWTLFPAIVLGGLLLGGPARAAGPAIRDDAHFFKPEAVRRAESVLRDIYDRHHQEVVIETFETPPGGEAKAKELASITPQQRGEFFLEWMQKRAREDRVNGVYILICKQPGHVEIGTGANTAQRAFTSSNRRELRNILVSNLQAKKPDQALIEGMDYIRDTMNANLRSSAESRTGRFATPIPGQVQRQRASWGGGIAGWVCLGLVVLLVVWLIVGLIRAFTGGGQRYGGGMGGGYPGAGYPGGGYGGYGGGFGGGGFMSGLLGGMFGAAAGNWMYDRFFRDGGSNSGGWGAPPTSGGDTGAGAGADYPAPDQGQDFQGTGGDFDDGSGGDFGGDGDSGGDSGGGDFGGGDDFGGGGDFSGGGGDF
jgi:hypothetical protein